MDLREVLGAGKEIQHRRRHRDANSRPGKEHHPSNRLHQCFNRRIQHKRSHKIPHDVKPEGTHPITQLNNYFFYRGGTSTGSDSYSFAKKPGCLSCELRINRLKPINILIEKSGTFSDLLSKIHDENPIISKQPFVNINEKMFYNPIDEARRIAK